LNSVLACACMAFSFLPFSAMAETELTYGSFLSSSHNVMKNAIVPFATAVEKESNGELRIRVLGDATVVSGPQSAKGLRNGVVDMAAISPIYDPSQTPLTAAITLLPTEG